MPRFLATGALVPSALPSSRMAIQPVQKPNRQSRTLLRAVREVSSGALAPGAEIFLGSNSVTETGKQAMHNAAEARDLVHF